MFIRANRGKYRVAKMCAVLEVSRSGYYAWEKRPKSAREIENEELTERIKGIFEKNRRVYGSRKIRKELFRLGKHVNHKRIEQIMKEEGLRAKTARKYKATTDSGHRMPVAENVLNREFEAVVPGEKFVSDITYRAPVWRD